MEESRETVSAGVKLTPEEISPGMRILLQKTPETRSGWVWRQSFEFTVQRVERLPSGDLWRLFGSGTNSLVNLDSDLTLVEDFDSRPRALRLVDEVFQEWTQGKFSAEHLVPQIYQRLALAGELREGGNA